MNINEIFSYKRLYFIGIGGVSMSGISEILIADGNYHISGSDNMPSILTDNLIKKGIKVYTKQDSSNITTDIDLVIYTGAIKDDNPEMIRAKELGIPLLERSEFLGQLMKAYDHPICVAGTHGKTTTTSIVSEVFLYAKKNPTISLGGILSSINSNFKVGGNDFFILETCEYRDTFLQFNPHSAIILNIDKDHLDYFKDLEQIRASFKRFASLIKSDACLVINGDIENYEGIVDGLNCSVITYGEQQHNLWTAKNIVFKSNGCPTYDAYFDNKYMYSISLNIVGIHNVYNSLSVCALSTFYNIPKTQIEQGISSFNGTNRRFQYKGKFNNVTVIDDYAHHPTEISATIASAKIQDIKKLWCVFQPHTYTRTKLLLDEFAHTLKDADHIIITDIYSAREQDNGQIHATDLVEKIKSLGKDAIYINNFEDGKLFLRKNCQQGDMLITMGAGNVNLLGEMFLTE